MYDKKLNYMDGLIFEMVSGVKGKLARTKARLSGFTLPWKLEKTNCGG